jgi:hypothetical protein
LVEDVLLGNNSPVMFGEGKEKNPLHTIEFKGRTNISSVLRRRKLPTSSYGILQPHFPGRMTNMLQTGRRSKY